MLKWRGIPKVFDTSIGGASSDPGRVLGLHLFADAVERIDTILQEIRHLQSNLIYTMRFPELNRALRYEESYIFGGIEVRNGAHDATTRPGGRSKNESWSTFFGRNAIRLDGERLVTLADFFVAVLPKAEDAYAFADRENADDLGHERSFPWIEDIIGSSLDTRVVTGPIVRELRRRTLRGDIDDSFERNYELFLALQLLKREAVVNRLFLCRAGLSAFDPGPEARAEHHTLFRQFLFLRPVLMDNVRQIVERLEDFHAQFDMTLDIGSQENHRPITGRRREQGIYHYVLDRRTREAFVLASDFVRATVDDKETLNQIFSSMPIVVHRWRHHFTSENAETLSRTRTVRARRQGGRLGTRPHFGAFAVNTSFWMPDRPDLQSIISHEAAHCVVVELFSDLAASYALGRHTGPLPNLIRGLLAASQGFYPGQPEVGTVGSSLTPQEVMVREITADVIALSISGPAYLFALFQELFGYGVEHTAGDISVRGWRNPVEADRVAREGWGVDGVDLDWYVRLMTSALVLEETVRDEEHNALTLALIAGVRACCEELLAHIGGLSERFVPDLTKRVMRQYEVVKQTFYSLMIFPDLRRYTTGKYPKDPSHDPSDAMSVRHMRFSPIGRQLLIEYFIERKATTHGRALRNALAHWIKHKKPTPDRQSVSDELMPGLFARSVELDAQPVKREVRTSPGAAAQAILWFHDLFIGSLPPEREKLIDELNSIRRIEEQHWGFVREVEEKHKEDKDRWIKEIAHFEKEFKKATRQHLKKMLDRVPMFERMGDIPWQAAVIRAAETIMEYRNAAPRTEAAREDDRCLVRTLATDYLPGRECVQLAIEFWTSRQRSRVTDLAEAVRLVRNALGSPNGTFGAGQLSPPPSSRHDCLFDTLKKNDVIDAPEHKQLTKCLNAWLGSALDADFAELEWERCLRAAWLEQTTLDTRALDRELVEIRSLKLRDQVVMALRPFEIEHLADLRDDIERLKTDDKDGLDTVPCARVAATTGAMQLLKLDRGYPCLDFGYSANEVYPFRHTETEAIKAFLDEICPKQKTADGPRDFDVPEQEFRIFDHYAADRDIWRKQLSSSERDVFDQCAAHILKHTACFLLQRIESISPVDCRRACEAFAGVARLRVDKTFPPHLRSPFQPVYDHKVAELCRQKMLALGKVLGKYRWIAPLAPLFDIIDVAHSQQDGLLRRIVPAISGGDAGLRRFDIVMLSRQSLIHAHWWREAVATASADHAARFIPAPIGRQLEHEDDKAPGTHRFATLGRYDFFVVATDMPINQLRLPIMDPGVGTKLKSIYTTRDAPFSRIQMELRYRSFFERRELAVRVSLGGWPAELLQPIQPPGEAQQTDEADYSKTDVLCFLSVRLARRAERLGFVNRLRRARRLWTEYHEDLAKGLESVNDLTQAELVDREKDGKNPFASLQYRKLIGEKLQNAIISAGGPAAQAATDLWKRPVNEWLKDHSSLHSQITTLKSAEITSNLHMLYALARSFGDLPDLPLEACGPFMRDGDSAMLGEGWADLILTIHCDSWPGDRDPDWAGKGREVWLSRGQRRLFDLFTMQHALFQDPGVFRTEMFIRPVAIPLAVYRPSGPSCHPVDQSRFQISHAIRTREDRELDGLIQRMIDAIRNNLAETLEDEGAKIQFDVDPAPEQPVQKFLAENVRLGHIPGRNDLEMLIDQLHRIVQMDNGTPILLDRSPSACLSLMHDLAGAGRSSGGGGSEEIITRIGFRHFLSGSRLRNHP